MKNIYLKALIGIGIRVIHILALKSMKDSSWSYECEPNLGCNEYNMIMEYLRPYKTAIQMFAAMLVDGFNNIMKEIDTSQLKDSNAELKDSNAELKDSNAELKASNAEMRRELNEIQERLNDHIITIPDDYIHEASIHIDHRIVPRIDINEEFKQVQHLHIE